MNDPPSFTKGADQTVARGRRRADSQRLGDGYQRRPGERVRTGADVRGHEQHERGVVLGRAGGLVERHIDLYAGRERLRHGDDHAQDHRRRRHGERWRERERDADLHHHRHTGERRAELHEGRRPDGARGLRRADGRQLGDRDQRRPRRDRPDASASTITDNTNAALFSAGPAVSSNGTLTYTPAANAFGTAAITLKAVDDGTPPAESADADVQHHGHRRQRRAELHQGRRPDRRRGCRRADGQRLGHGYQRRPAERVRADPDVRDHQQHEPKPLLGGAGGQPGRQRSPTRRPPTGTAAPTITLRITDNGGTANGGVNESATQTFVITITAVNDAPTSPGQNYGANSLQANMQRSIAAGSRLARRCGRRGRRRRQRRLDADVHGRHGQRRRASRGHDHDDDRRCRHRRRDREHGRLHDRSGARCHRQRELQLHRLRQRRRPARLAVQRGRDGELQHRRPGDLVRQPGRRRRTATARSPVRSTCSPAPTPSTRPTIASSSIAGTTTTGLAAQLRRVADRPGRHQRANQHLRRADGHHTADRHDRPADDRRHTPDGRRHHCVRTRTRVSRD